MLFKINCVLALNSVLTHLLLSVCFCGRQTYSKCKKKNKNEKKEVPSIYQLLLGSIPTFKYMIKIVKYPIWMQKLVLGLDSLSDKKKEKCCSRCKCKIWYSNVNLLFKN